MYTGAQINFGDLTPYLTYGYMLEYNAVLCIIRPHKGAGGGGVAQNAH